MTPAEKWRAMPASVQDAIIRDLVEAADNARFRLQRALDHNNQGKIDLYTNIPEGYEAAIALLRSAAKPKRRRK